MAWVPRMGRPDPARPARTLHSTTERHHTTLQHARIQDGSAPCVAPLAPHSPRRRAVVLAAVAVVLAALPPSTTHLLRHDTRPGVGSMARGSGFNGERVGYMASAWVTWRTLAHRGHRHRLGQRAACKRGVRCDEATRRRGDETGGRRVGRAALARRRAHLSFAAARGGGARTARAPPPRRAQQATGRPEERRRPTTAPPACTT